MSKLQAHQTIKPFEASRVQLLPSQFQDAMGLDKAYLLSLEPDRLLHSFRTIAGLPPKGEVYGGWEVRQVAGHSLGHYLSAISRMGSQTEKETFKARAKYIVEELALCQNANQQGYAGALPDADTMWKKLRNNDPQGVLDYWAPWYTIHKYLAGLIDVHQYFDNPLALTVAEKFGDWVIWVTENLSPENWQRMLENEHGGMNESLAHLYGLTHEKKYLDISHKFYHQAVLDPLSKGVDDFNGLHANTQIPKIIGCATLYNIEGDQKHHDIAVTFWDKMVHHHTYAIGGNSVYEHLGLPDKLSDTLNETDCETCNTYNMIKLTNLLFCWNPKAEYGDYVERALINHILSSQNNQTGMMCYYVTLKPNTRKVFCTPFDSFWCCTGTGMENHARYGESIYFQGENDLIVSQYVSSVLDWKEKNAKVKMVSDFPSKGNVAISFEKAPSHPISLMFRKPYWAVGNPFVQVNGKTVAHETNSNGFIEVHHHFNDGDTVHLAFGMDYHAWPMPDNKDRVAFFYGPTVLAGNFGSSGADFHNQVPAILSSSPGSVPAFEWKTGDNLHVMTNHVGRPQDYTMMPFNQVTNQKTTVYWDLISQQEWEARELKIQQDLIALKALDARTIDHFLPGVASSEKEHGLVATKSGSGGFDGRFYRDASDGGTITWNMKVLPNQPIHLTLTFWGSDGGGRVFDVVVDGKVVKTITLENNHPDVFYAEEIRLPAVSIDTITVSLAAKPGQTAGGVFGARTLRD